MAPVVGASVEPGLRQTVGSSLVRSLRSRGVPAGPRALRVEVLSASQRPEAAAGGRTVAFVATLSLTGTLEGAPECRVEAAGRRSFLLASDAPLEGAVARSGAFGVLADEVAGRLVDRVMGSASCR